MLNRNKESNHSMTQAHLNLVHNSLSSLRTAITQQRALIAFPNQPS